MYQYTLMQWVLFFYLYCFLGWVWESFYVSIRKRQWTNRGFMHGPFLPIYGSGAITILLATIPVKEHLVLVYLLGMIAATLLEYVTGVLMEYLFHVRYWDYSQQPCNYKGHICLLSSLAWGFFSVLMVKVIHVPIANLVTKIPDQIEQVVTFVLTILVVADFTVSFREAMDIRQLLETLVENNDELKRLQRRMDVLVAVVNDDKEHFTEKWETSKDNFTEKWETSKDNFTEKWESSKDNITGKLETSIENLTEKIQSSKDSITEKLETSKENVIDRMKSDEIKKLHHRITAMEAEHTFHKKMFAKSYRRANSIMKRNAIVTSKKYTEALQQLKEYKQMKRKK